MVGSELNCTWQAQKENKGKKKQRETGLPLFFSLVNFSQSLYYLNAWNRLEIQILTVKKNFPGLEHFVELFMIRQYM